MGRWKGLRLKAHGDPDAAIELYDLEADPNETTDVAADHPEVVARIGEVMAEQRTVSGVPRWNFAPEHRPPDRPSPGTDS